MSSVIFFPSFSKVYEVREAFKNKSKDIDTEGRPKIWLSGEEIAEICIEAVSYTHLTLPTN